MHETFAGDGEDSAKVKAPGAHTSTPVKAVSIAVALLLLALCVAVE
ncbi:hypothetical protein [Nonomuraea sp. NPDC002799]